MSDEKKPLTAGEVYAVSMIAATRAAEEAFNHAELVAEAVARRLAPPSSTAPEAVLLDVEEAAALLGITVDALNKRVSRRQVGGIVRTGRRIQFHKAKLLESLERKVRHGGG